LKMGTVKFTETSGVQSACTRGHHPETGSTLVLWLPATYGTLVPEQCIGGFACSQQGSFLWVFQKFICSWKCL